MLDPIGNIQKQKEIKQFLLDDQETFLFYISNESGNNELWLKNVENGEISRLTDLKGDITNFVLSESNNCIIFTVQFDGREVNQLYKYNLVDRGIEKLNNQHAGSIHLVKEMDGVLYLIMDDYTYRLDIENNDWQVFDHVEVIEISPALRNWIEIEYVSHTHINLFLKNSQNRIPLAIHSDISALAFWDEESIYYSSSEDERSVLHFYSIKDHRMRIVKDFGGYYIQDLAFNKNANKLYVHTQYGVRDYLWVFDLETDSVEKIEFPGSVILQLMTGRHNLYILTAGMHSYTNIYMGSEKDNYEWNEVLELCPDQVGNEMYQPQIIVYSSFDQQEIEAIFYEAENPNGLTFVWLHGGPQENSRAVYNSYFHSLRQMGFHVFIPNFRGSSGYGVKFQNMANKDWGNAPRLDVVEGISYLKKSGRIDKEQIIFSGMSYGGYLALLLGALHPKITIAAINLFGPADLIKFILDCPLEWKPFMKEWLGTIEEDYESLIKVSPFNYVDHFESPVLIAHGENDRRTSLSSVEGFVEEMKKYSKDIHFLKIENEGHGFTQEMNQMKLMGRIYDFLAGCLNSQVVLNK
jgi:dipeptidyl aminopeptidase/acylaminoacyl peptidase